MRIIVPEGYRDFHCIAGRCRHTCCARWEIDIDPETLARYRSMPGSLGEELRAGIVEEDGTARLVLDEKERCPMLREDGLCRIILERGEEALCQICADHPRFRGFFSDTICMGLGLCCEEAARLYLSREEPFRLEVLEDDGEREGLTEDEAWLLSWESELLSILCDRSMPLPDRLDRVTEAAGCDPQTVMSDAREVCGALLALEQLDPAWTALLTACKEGAVPWPRTTDDFDRCFERLACLLLYRHLPGALEDGRPEAHAMMCVLLTRLAQALFAMGERSMERLIDVVRLLSSELEYSDEAIEELISMFDA